MSVQPVVVSHRPRRICIVAPYAGPVLLQDWSRRYAGGAEVQQVILARALVQRGHDVSFIIQAERPSGFELDGIHVYAYPRARVAPGINAGIKCSRLWRLLAKIRPELIYQRMADWTTGVCGLFAQAKGTAFIHAVASDRDVSASEPMDGNWWQARSYYWGLRRATLVLAQHRGQMESLSRDFEIDSLVFPSLYPDPPEESREVRRGVYWIAMLRPNKRPELFLELARRLPDVHFVMIGGPEGDPASRAYFDRVAALANAEPNVRFAGFLAPWDVDSELAGAQVLVSTTQPTREGLPVAFLQAWRRGVPTVAFSAPGLDEVLQQTGWSIQSLDELTTLIESGVAQPELFSSRGAQARRYFAAHHALSVVIPQFEALAARAIEKASKARAPAAAVAEATA